jgi:hypothetical protein
MISELLLRPTARSSTGRPMEPFYAFAYRLGRLAYGLFKAPKGSLDVRPEVSGAPREVVTVHVSEVTIHLNKPPLTLESSSATSCHGAYRLP